MTTPEFTILDDALVFHDGVFQHALFWLEDHRSGTRVYRAVMLRELAYVPIEARENPDVLGKQWMAVRGLYNTAVDFSYVALGAFQPRPLGVAQFYGAQAEASADGEHWAMLYRGERAASGLLLRLNLTTLPAGPLTLRLTAVDRTGNYPPPCVVRAGE